MEIAILRAFLRVSGRGKLGKEERETIAKEVWEFQLGQAASRKSVFASSYIEIERDGVRLTIEVHITDQFDLRSSFNNITLSLLISCLLECLNSCFGFTYFSGLLDQHTWSQEKDAEGF